MKEHPEIIVYNEEQQPFLLTHPKNLEFEEKLLTAVPVQCKREYPSDRIGFKTLEIHRGYLPIVVGLVREVFNEYRYSFKESSPINSKSTNGQMNLFNM